MSEYIGARISLISRADIRYVGTLHQIDSDSSTVALENVQFMGTEGRMADPDKEVPPNPQIFEYIVFKGGDVKDLRIEEKPQEKTAPAPSLPDDPAIMGSTRPPHQQPPAGQRNSPFNQQQHYPPPYGPFPPQHRFGPPPGGFPPGPPPPHGFPGYGGPPGPPGPFGPPPGYYGPPGQGFPIQPPGPFSPSQQNHAPVSAAAPQQPQITTAAPAEKQELSAEQPKHSVTQSANKATTTATSGPTSKTPNLPMEPRQGPIAGSAPPGLSSKTAPTGPKGSRIVPAVPLPSPGISAGGQPNPGTAAPPPTSSVQPQKSYANATQAATAAVAAAMAKLGPKPGAAPGTASASDPMDNLARKVSEMRTDDQNRRGRGQGHRGGERGGRGRRGSGREFSQGGQRSAVEVPKEDYDFSAANAKFNKEDLVKEAIATGSPIGTPDEGGDGLNGDASHPNETNGADEEVVIPAATSGNAYNKSSSFFDNLSSDLKDREEVQTGNQQLGGREFRNEERKKNMDTFGQASVDNFRGGYRGRGRGRGFRGGSRGFGGRGRGGPRGGAQTGTI